MWIATFQPLTAGLYQAMVSTEHVSLYVAPWLFVIGAFWSSLWLFLIGGFRSPLFWYSFHIAVMGRRCLDFNDGKLKYVAQGYLEKSRTLQYLQKRWCSALENKFCCCIFMIEKCSFYRSLSGVCPLPIPSVPKSMIVAHYRIFIDACMKIFCSFTNIFKHFITKYNSHLPSLAWTPRTN